jgi:hypothetical protein
MRKIILISLLFAFAAQGQQLQRIAILNTEDDVEPPISISELSFLTAKLREVANNILPKNRYGVMTSESIVERLGSQEQAAKICREATCLVDLGRKVSAEFVAQARIGRFGGNLTIKTELYNVRSGNLIASFTGDSKDVHGLLSVLEIKAPALFMSMPNVSSEPVPGSSSPAVVAGGIMIGDNSSFGMLSIKAADSSYEGWSLTINDKAYSSFENMLSPGAYDIKLSHKCYEDINFKVGVSKGSNEVFDMASYVKLKEGILELKAKGNISDDEQEFIGFVSKPVFVNGKHVGETPFSGSVPVCSNVEIGENREAVGINLKYGEKVICTHKKGSKFCEEQNFSTGQRVGTGLLNMLLPGVGSIAVMDDWTGGLTTLALFGGGVALGLIGGQTCAEIVGLPPASDDFSAPNSNSGSSSTSCGNSTLFYVGIVTAISGYIYGAFIRPAFYDKPTPKNTAYRNEGFNFTAMPNRHGNFMPAVFYNKAF